MSRRKSPGYRQALPEQAQIVRLLKKYGHTLFEPCPSSENLVLYSEDSALLPEQDVHAIERHLTVCLDCRDKVRWLSEPEDEHAGLPPGAVTTFVLPVQAVPKHDPRVNDPPLAYAAGSSSPGGETLPSVPYITTEDGAVYAEIGRDFEDRLFLHIEQLSSAYRWHAIRVRAFTRDGRVLETECTALTGPRIEFPRQPGVKPEDLLRIELQFVNLRPY